jgi:uncharacterized membrane protein
VLAAALVISTVPAPQAVAADCVYTAKELPVPDGTFAIHPSGTSPDNHLIIGFAHPSAGSDWKRRDLVWQDGELSQMADPPVETPDTIVTANDINNSGTIAATVHELRYDSHAVRYENGSYEFLHTEENERSWAKGINENGDIIGEIAPKDQERGPRRVALWPKDGPRRLYGEGYAVDLSDDRELVMYTGEARWVIDENGSWTQISEGGGYPTVFDDDRILDHQWGDDGPEVREWTLTGEHVATYPGGALPYGRNSSGKVLLRNNDTSLVLWQGDSSTPVRADESLSNSLFVDITDDDVLIGTRRGPDGYARPALWSCS